MRAAALVSLLAAACTPSDAPVDAGPDLLQVCPPMPTIGDLPCDVGAVLTARCQVCHTLPRKNGAPFPLLTYEMTHAQFGTTTLLKWQRMKEVIEPGNFPHMPPADHPQLTHDDFTTLHNWFAACAPPVAEGAGCDVGEPDGGVPDDLAGTGDAGPAQDASTSD